MKRKSGVEKYISEISGEFRVSVIGRVIKIDDVEYSMIIDDGEGSCKVFSEELHDVGKMIRVIGRVHEDGIAAEIIQDFSNFDFETFKKLKELEKSL